jgi:hypothetical protein
VFSILKTMMAISSCLWSSSRFDDAETFVDWMVALGYLTTQLVSLPIQIASSIDRFVSCSDFPCLDQRMSDVHRRMVSVAFETLAT